MNNDTIETEELNKKAGKVEIPEDAADIINEYEEILPTKRKGIITVAYHQGKVFSQFREKEKFITLKHVWSAQEHSFIENQSFQTYAKLSQIKKVFSDFKFFEKLL